MFKQVFDYNGNPYILRVDNKNNVLESEIEKYQLYKFTEIMPPKELYPPRTFDGSKWHGSTVEEYENGNKPPVITPDETQMVLANLQMQLVQSESKVKNLESSYDELRKEIDNIKGSAD